MDYSFDERGDAMVVAIRGRVDEATWVAFGVGLSDGIEKAQQARLKRMIIDLAGLD